MRLPSVAAVALREQNPNWRWRAACAISLGLAPAALGFALTTLALLAESASLLDSGAGKDIILPVIVGIVAAALYDRATNARELYWERIDDSLNAVLNRLDYGAHWYEPATCDDPPGPECQRRKFNLTRPSLASYQAKERKLALKRILDASVCSQAWR